MQGEDALNATPEIIGLTPPPLALNIQGAPSRAEVEAALATAQEFREEVPSWHLTIVPDGPSLMTYSHPDDGLAKYRFGGEAELRGTPVRIHDIANLVAGDVREGAAAQFELYGSIGVVGALQPDDAWGASPVIDAVDGTLLGFVSPTGRVSLPGAPGLEPLLQGIVEQDRAQGPDLVLRHIDVSRTSQVAVISYLKGLNSRAFRLATWGAEGDADQSRLVACPAIDGVLAPPVGTYASFPNISRTEAWPMQSLLMTGDQPGKGLAIFLGGGPWAPAYDFRRGFRYSALREMGFDILAPTLSGALDEGAEMRERLLPDPVAALERDADEIAAYVLGPAGDRYQRIVIVGESFGGGLGLAVLERLRERSPDLVLLSPWLKYVPASERSENPVLQDAFEDMSLDFGEEGRREAYFDWIDGLLDSAYDDAHAFVAFGEWEDRVDLSIVPRLEANENATVLVLPKMGHEVAIVSADTWREIDRFLAAVDHEADAE